MSAAVGSSGSRALHPAGIAIAAVLLTGFFLVLGFPYDRLADRLTREIERESGVRIDLASVSPGWVRWGLGLEAHDVRVQQPDGTRLELSRLGVRPAVSLSWLSGSPALATALEAPLGHVSGTLTLGRAPGFTGTLRDADLAQLPIEGPSAPRLEGSADAEVDVRLAEAGPEGTLRFVARQGSIAHGELPVALPFEELRGDVLFGGDHWAEVRELELRSPLASGSARGTIGRAAELSTAPLRLEIDLAVEGMIRSALESQLTVGRDGRLRATLAGTLGRPVLRRAP